MKKLAVIANCQAAPLAATLAGLPGIKEALAVQLHLMQGPQFEKTEADLDALLAESDSMVFTFNVSARQGRFSTEALRQRCNRVVTMTNVHFAGLHPDITYLGVMGNRLHSPMGDYHSRIVLDAFLQGSSPAECEAQFNGQNYAQRGYFDAYGVATRNLLARDQDLDVQFASEFLEMVPLVPTLYTVNHLTAPVFQAFASRLAETLGMRLPIFPVQYLRNHQSDGAWWPVYDEIAEAAGLKYRTPMVFQQPQVRGGKLLTLTEMISRSYALYTRMGAQLSAAWPAAGAVPSAA